MFKTFDVLLRPDLPPIMPVPRLFLSITLVYGARKAMLNLRPLVSGLEDIFPQDWKKTKILLKVLCYSEEWKESRAQTLKT